MSLPFLTPVTAKKWLCSGVPSRDAIIKRFALEDPLCASSNGTLLTEDEVRKRVQLNGLQWRARDHFSREVSFAIPCKEVIELIGRSKRIVELGAGSGFWAALLKNIGVDIIACDLSKSTHGIARGVYFPVAAKDAQEFVGTHQTRDVLMVWPSYNDPWSGKVAKQIRTGRKLYLVHEGEGGCIGDDTLYRVLRRDYKVVEECALPQWPHIHDRLTVYLRATRRA